MTVDRQLTDQLTVARACCLLAGGGGGVEADNKKNCKSPVLLSLLFFSMLSLCIFKSANTNHFMLSLILLQTVIATKTWNQPKQLTPIPSQVVGFLL